MDSDTKSDCDRICPGPFSLSIAEVPQECDTNSVKSPPNFDSCEGTTMTLETIYVTRHGVRDRTHKAHLAT